MSEHVDELVDEHVDELVNDIFSEVEIANFLKINQNNVGDYLLD